MIGDSIGGGVTPGYGIKRIYAAHLFPPKPYFEASMADGLPALMNFNSSVEGRKLAASIAVGSRALVYVTEAQLFVWAIEFMGTASEGEEARKRHGIGIKDHAPFSVYVPIRFLAKIEPWDKGATRHQVCADSGMPFEPTQGDSHVSLTREQFERMYNAICWTRVME